MQVNDQVVLVTGGASGIGEALCRRFHAEGAGAVAVADRDAAGAERVAAEIGGLAIEADVSRQDDIRRAVAATQARFGPIDLLCSNAGVLFTDAPGWMATSQSDERWETAWKVNVMAHVWGARAVLPGMIRRRRGYLLQTVSAAGLLHQIGDAAYSTTKHAAIGFAESLAITHGEQGIGVSVLCPQAVATPMLTGAQDDEGARRAAEAASADGVLSPEEVADAVIRGLDAESFLILPHSRVRDYLRNKASDYDRWIRGMRRLRRKLYPDDRMMQLHDTGELL